MTKPPQFRIRLDEVASAPSKRRWTVDPEAINSAYALDRGQREELEQAVRDHCAELDRRDVASVSDLEMECLIDQARADAEQLLAARDGRARSGWRPTLEQVGTWLTMLR